MRMRRLSRTEAVIRAAKRMPAYYRRLRAQAMLEPLCRSMGLGEVACPGCGGRGWLSERGLRHCPACVAMGTVPRCVAGYVERQMRRLRSGTGRRWPTQAEVRMPFGEEGRWGRAALVLHRVAPEATLDALT